MAWGRLSEKVTWELRNQPQEDLGKGVFQEEQVASAKVQSQTQVWLASRNLQGTNEAVVCDELRETERARWFRACKPRGDAWLLIQVGWEALRRF